MRRRAAVSVDAGARLVALARAAGASSIAVVGTMKNAGKTVTFGAVCDALARSGTPYAAISIGRDGEAIDAVTQTPKPRIRLAAGTIFATARPSVPAHPAAEILEVTDERAAIGRVVIARARVACRVELAGPATADGLRRVARRLARSGAIVVLDGAIDRLAALRDGDDAIVIAVGAAGLRTVREGVDAARALVLRLALPVLDAGDEALAIEGALTAEVATALARAAERRAIVVGDATRIAFGGRTFLALRDALRLRVRRALRPIACTVAPSGAGASFEPRAFLEAVAEATRLPAFDVYAAEGRELRT